LISDGLKRSKKKLASKWEIVEKQRNVEQVTVLSFEAIQYDMKHLNSHRVFTHY